MRRLMVEAVVAATLLFPSIGFARPSGEDASDERDSPKDAKVDGEERGEDRGEDDEADEDFRKNKKKKKKSKRHDDGDDDVRTWGHGGEVPTESNPDVMSGEHRWDVHLLDFMTFGVGFLSGAGGNFLDKPGDQTLGGVAVDPPYPGFVGLTSGVGPTFEVRFFGYGAIELDVLVQSDSGTADITVSETVGGQIQSQVFTVEIAQKAIHMPLLFKGMIPGRIVTPVLFLGPEFVFVSESTSQIVKGSVPSFHGVRYDAKNPDSYTAFMFGLGLELNLPIPYVDVRIPFNLRGTVNPGVSDKREERMDFTGTPPALTTVAISTEWKFQAMANMGLAVHF